MLTLVDAALALAGTTSDAMFIVSSSLGNAAGGKGTADLRLDLHAGDELL